MMRTGWRRGGSLALVAVLGLVACGPGEPSEREVAAAARPPLAEAPPVWVERVVAAEQAFDDASAAEAWQSLAFLYHANGYAGPALRAYDRLRQLDPEEPRWWHLAGCLRAGHGELPEAEPLLQRAVALAPGYPAAALKLAEVRMKLNRPAEAAAAYRQALVAAPGSPWALHGLARFAADDGRWPEARRWLEQATAAHPEFFAANNLLATTYEKLGLGAAADVARQRARAADRHREPSDPWVEELAGWCYDVYQLQVQAAAAANSARARALLERAKDLAPQDARVRRQLGRVLLQAGEPKLARQELEAAIVLQPDDPAYHLDLLAVFKAQRNPEAARRCVEDGLRQHPDAAGLHFEYALLEEAAGRSDNAIAHLERARRAAPDQPAASAELARHRFKQGQTGEALALLDEALARDPSHLPCLLLYARYHVRRDDEAEAVRWLQRARRNGGTTNGELEQVRREFAARFRHPAP